jgi:hypothetical protein
MTNREIIKGLEQLSNAERLSVIEAARRMIQEDIRHDPSHRDVREQVLAAAAEELASDYSSDVELTSFTALDSEDFQHA